MGSLYIEESVYGDFLPFIRTDSVTDINYNGNALWIDDLKKGRYCVNGMSLSDQFLNRFSMRIANLMNRSFNQYEPLLEAETDEVRISIIHESVTNSGRSISIRKTPGIRRLSREKILETGYCCEQLDYFLACCVKAGLNIIAAGLPGAGKTEYLKYLTDYIEAHQKVITIEDNIELRYRTINPYKDCVEIKVGETFSYAQAIKASMRQLPSWVILSEARSNEVKYLLECMSTGISCMTTVHTDDVRRIPDRFCNMLKQDVSADVYSFLDIGVLIGCYHVEGEGIKRRIEQACLFERENGQNSLQVFYENGIFRKIPLSDSLKRKFLFAGICDPFLSGGVA